MARRRWVSSLLLALAPLSAHAEVFIQGSEVNLRAAPDATATIVGKVRIGTACAQQEGAPADWVKLKCGDLEGFTKAKLVGPAKPDPAALLARAKDPSLKASDRLDAALRAAGLAPDDESVLQVANDAFYDAEFESLPKGGKLAVGRVSTDLRCSQNDRLACLYEMISLDEYDALDARTRGDNAVLALSTAGELHVLKVALGSASQNRSKEYVFHVSVVARAHYAPGTVLGDVVRLHARRRPSDRAPASALVIPGASTLKLADSLPSAWLPVEKVDGAWKQECGDARSFEIMITAVGEVSVKLPTGDAYRVAEIVQTGPAFRISYLREDDPSRGIHHDKLELVPLQLEWPSAEAGVGLLNGRAFIPARKLPASARRSCPL